jgi:hypothetical protein
MFSRMKISNLFYSFGIGAAIGLSSQILIDASRHLPDVLLNVLISGMIGFLIGAVIEVILALVPIRLANAKTYFIISNLVALSVTAIVIVFPFYVVRPQIISTTDLFRVLGVAFIIIVAANIFDYFRYKRANQHLKDFKNSYVPREE